MNHHALLGGIGRVRGQQVAEHGQGEGMDGVLARCGEPDHAARSSSEQADGIIGVVPSESVCTQIAGVWHVVVCVRACVCMYVCVHARVCVCTHVFDVCSYYLRTYVQSWRGAEQHIARWSQ
jgi:hypothetical protein